MSSSQLSEWEAYDRIDPIGTWRDDFRLAYISSLMVNIVRAQNVKKGEKPKFTIPLDFMLDWSGTLVRPQPEKQSWETMKQILTGLTETTKKRKNKKIIPPIKVAPHKISKKPIINKEKP